MPQRALDHDGRSVRVLLITGNTRDASQVDILVV